MKESYLKVKLFREMRKRNIYFFRAVVTGVAGVPDIVVCCKGKFVGLELKNSNSFEATMKKWTPIQRYTARKIIEAGGFYTILCYYNNAYQAICYSSISQLQNKCEVKQFSTIEEFLNFLEGSNA